LRPEARVRVEAFLSQVASASQALLMLAYDGTLAPLRAVRSEAAPYPGVVEHLRAIAACDHTRIVIVTGREASDVLSFLDVPRLEICGEYGLQRRFPDGRMTAVRPRPGSSEALVTAEHWLRYQHLHHLAEFKTGSIAVHWRGFPKMEIDKIRGQLALGWDSIARSAGLELFEFDGGLEVCVPEADKSRMVRILLGEMPPDSPAAYLADDSPDERAFRFLSSRGLTALVRPSRRRTAAQVWLRPPGDLLQFLRMWAEACGAPNPSEADCMEMKSR
jgi:trehalose-phosphatase